MEKPNSLKDAYGLHWFCRDLRILGNAGLEWNHREFHGRVLGIYCWQNAESSSEGYPANQNLFLLETLAALKSELEQRGSGLLFFEASPSDAFKQLLQKLEGRRLPAAISWNRCYEPSALRDEEAIRELLTARGIVPHSERDQLLIEPHEIFKESNKRQPYQVYTPFRKQWMKAFQTGDVTERVARQKKALRRRASAQADFGLTGPELLTAPFYEASSQRLANAIEKLRARVSITLPSAGHKSALLQVKAFAKSLDAYHEQRDIPSIGGTSRFSAYLNNGSLTIDQVIASYDLGAAEEADSARHKFFGELIWREFYYYILSRFPYVELESFNSRYRSMRWDNREDWFTRWKEGQTGYPIVDAGMRELLETGWMHNRVRMIVASFLCKDLLIDWRWGEKHFLEHLIDGDPALNNGGWQWAASTGCDPQPYFRIFNPELQSQKFDPEGLYIKRFVPELMHLSPKRIHAPDKKERGSRYPLPLVDHAAQKPKALALYKSSGTLAK